MELHELRIALKAIRVHKHLMCDPVMTAFTALLDALHTNQAEQALERYTDLYFALQEQQCAHPGAWLEQALFYRESPYSQALALAQVSDSLLDAVAADLATFSALSTLECDRLVSAIAPLLDARDAAVLDTLPRWNTCPAPTMEQLTAFYKVHGAGLFARYRAFLWENGELIPVAQPDCPKPEELLGYEMQRAQVVANTRALLEGHRVNNVLLFGDSGTGKSATVKSLISLPGFDSLRLIEVQKDGLSDLTRLIRSLRSKPQKFILFIDDLAFDQDDKVFSALKSILEGGLEPRPVNVAVYATSNRRHLVRQTFSERAGEEVDTFETIAEKTALSERFGLRIPYQNMDKKGYLALVDHLAGLEGITMDAEQLHALAMKWDIRHGGRTPRSARQFIASLSVEE
ncbi:MAG: ATP-binding protein [Oscillospiraceae bacterium]|nr:ATP-binding protein [Oscillospiraceae bacterium]